MQLSGPGSHTGRLRGHADLRRTQCDRRVVSPTPHSRAAASRSGVGATVQGVPVCQVPSVEEGPATSGEWVCRAEREHGDSRRETSDAGWHCALDSGSESSNDGVGHGLGLLCSAIRETASQVASPSGGARAGATLGSAAVRFGCRRRASLPSTTCCTCRVQVCCGFAARRKVPRHRDDRYAPATPRAMVVWPAEDGHPARVLLAAVWMRNRFCWMKGMRTPGISLCYLRTVNHDPASSRV
jgi:hypothetical protein